jgi:cytochrome c
MQATTSFSVTSGRLCAAGALLWCVVTAVAHAGPPSPASASKGNATLGKAIYEAKCTACHSPEDNRVGPKHAGVVGRRSGSVKGYDYSPELARSKVVWTQAKLVSWLTDPEAVIPGQRMGYRLGIAQERADVVAYLATLK